MLDPQKIDDLVRQLSKALPPELMAAEQETRKHFKSILESAFQKLDLVSREEFDIQVKVLQKTRAKLEALEASLESLQKNNDQA